MRHSRPKRYTNWYLRDWMKAQEVSQTQLVDSTDLSKTAVSLLYNDRQDYTPAIIRDVAAALNIEPYELLMPPAKAHALRRQREDSLRIVEDTEPLRTGTDD